jgi:2-dehydro-3-deoxyphosphogluconate aldolase / (4S)-4-hydroxy-2-oxoglutarate aldolase
MKYLNDFESQYVIPVIRHTKEDELYKLCLALADGGLKVLEVTLMSDAAYTVIDKLKDRKDLIIGAGTVLNKDQAKRAIDCGAKFLVSPGLDEASIHYSQSQNIPFVPGVITPSEIMQAHNLGLNLLKLFPASTFGGLEYVKSLKGPFPHMKWMLTGGITPADVPIFKKAGISCVGLGNHLTSAALVEKEDWKGITELTKNLLKKVQED